MTKSAEARAIITGSFVLYLIDSLVDGNKAQTHKDVKKVRKALLAQASKPQFLPYVKLSNQAWQKVVDQYKDKNYRVIIFDAVEHLVLGEEQAMEEMFGDGFVDDAMMFCMAFSDQDIPNDGLGESREICKELTKILKQLVFEHLK
jgi:hypothetical protein